MANVLSMHHKALVSLFADGGQAFLVVTVFWLRWIAATLDQRHLEPLLEPTREKKVECARKQVSYKISRSWLLDAKLANTASPSSILLRVEIWRFFPFPRQSLHADLKEIRCP